MHYLSDQNILLFLIQFFLLLGSAKLLGALFNKWKQPTVTADILVGVILGPTILGRFFPKIHNFIFPNNPAQQDMLETVAWIGILFLLLETGLAVNFSSIWKQKKEAIKISISGIIFPLVASAIPIFFLLDKYMVNPESRMVFTVFLATIMSISTMSIAIRAMHDLNLLKTDMGFLVISALSINDIIGWIMFTIILGIFTQASVNLSQIFLICIGTIGFTAIALTAGKKFIDAAISKVKIRYKDHAGPSLTLICLLGLFCGIITEKIGIHSLFGFFIAGIIAGEAKDLPEKSRNAISQIVYAVFVPIFFANIGLKIDVLANLDIPLVIFVTVVGIIVRFLGAWFGSHLAKIPKSDSVPISILHIPGGEMHIVIGILALKYGFITHQVFVAIVMGAIISCIVLGPWLSFSIKRRSKVNILDFISKQAIIQNLISGSKGEAIKELCILGADIGKIDHTELINKVMEREEIMSTGLEKEIAIPHARMASLKRPVVVFGRSQAGIDWDSIDGRPAKFIFLVLTPQTDDDMQIQIYSRIGKMIRDQGIKENIIKSNSAEETWNILKKGFSEQGKNIK